jgi:hypothetical protein
MLLKSAKGAAARRQGGKELASLFGGALDTAAFLRVFLKSAKGTKPYRRTGEEPLYRGGLGVPVLRVFLKSAKGTKPCRRTGEEPVYRGGLGVPVLRVFLKSGKNPCRRARPNERYQNYPPKGVASVEKRGVGMFRPKSGCLCFHSSNI